MIFASGNLSWLNFLTIVLAIPLIDDRLFAAVLSVSAPPDCGRRIFSSRA